MTSGLSGLGFEGPEEDLIVYQRDCGSNFNFPRFLDRDSFEVGVWVVVS
jgi:hypothetical protein